MTGTFATVKRRKLLNSQKGELMAVSVTRVGEEQVETAAGPSATRTRSATAETSISTGTGKR